MQTLLHGLFSFFKNESLNSGINQKLLYSEAFYYVKIQKGLD